MLVLGIESTCDETAAAVVEDGKVILSNVIRSQAEVHAQYGGVFPEVAARLHVDALLPVIEEALKEAKIKPEDIDLIAAARGPGLMGAILLGLNAAKTLALSLNKPFVGINHVEAHIYAAMMNNPLLLPALGVVVSGGHTLLLRVDKIGTYEIIGTTIDDAIGEAFDKIASILDLPYPGGPHIEKLAKKGNPLTYNFKRAKAPDFNFSFSGLKTKILYLVKGQKGSRKSPSLIGMTEKKDIAAAFQKTVLEDVLDKALRAALKYSCRAIYVGGGVSNNEYLRKLFKETPIPSFFPSKPLSLDNGAMIAGLAYFQFKEKSGDSLNLPAVASFKAC